MGNYVDEDRILKLMPQLPKTSGTGYSQTSDLITLAIEKSEAEIDSYLSTKYALPFDPVPPVIRNLADELSQYHVTLRLYSGDNMARNEYTEQFRAWDHNPYETLKRIQNNDMLLTATDGSLVATKTAARSIKTTHSDYAPTFNIDEPTQWAQDSDLLDEVADER